MEGFAEERCIFYFERVWRLWRRENDQPHHTGDAFSTHKRGWGLWGSKNDQLHHSWDAFNTHQKKGWHQTGRRSAAALRGIRVRGASLFSRMWEGAAAPLRGGFPKQPHHWEEDFWISRTVERTSGATALLEERKYSAVLLGFKDLQEEVFNYVQRMGSHHTMHHWNCFLFLLKKSY